MVLVPMRGFNSLGANIMFAERFCSRSTRHYGSMGSVILFLLLSVGSKSHWCRYWQTVSILLKTVQIYRPGTVCDSGPSCHISQWSINVALWYIGKVHNVFFVIGGFDSC